MCRRRWSRRSSSRRRTWIQTTGKNSSDTITSSSRRIWPATSAKANASGSRSTTTIRLRRTKVGTAASHAAYLTAFTCQGLSFRSFLKCSSLRVSRRAISWLHLESKSHVLLLPHFILNAGARIWCSWSYLTAIRKT